MLEYSTIYVAGEPIPQGSMRAFNNRIVHSSGAKLKAWRASIAAAYTGELMEGPVEVSMVFAVPRPKTVKRSVPSVRPDLDKLVRAVLDSLTGVAYKDDGQVIRLTAHKQYDSQPGVRIIIHRLPDA